MVKFTFETKHFEKQYEILRQGCNCMEAINFNLGSKDALLKLKSPTTISNSLEFAEREIDFFYEKIKLRSFVEEIQRNGFSINYKYFKK